MSNGLSKATDNLAWLLLLHKGYYEHNKYIYTLRHNKHIPSITISNSREARHSHY